MPDIETQRAQQHGRIIKEKRLLLGLNRPAFVAEMARHGHDITPDYLNKLERGTAPLARASLTVREGIRTVLGYSAQDWQALTGLYAPEAATTSTHALPRPPVPPVVDPVTLPLVIPLELQQIIDDYGAQFPELRNDTTLRALVAPRLFAGHSQGPQTPEQWLEYFLMNRRWFPQ
ncbi:hypothetical protein D3875_15915 [Deinococcus cavernae]|uniref:Uncharacterized protein n=1 Tax=Deinococcus cavernae TaxID=2320857 RepID=A0A418V9S1_9DEIO|nr:hypothetical protein [Deinococcus cavernae]RJF72807.1 hypothetical protein D3875_15915 [Deinococcus cavernae]